MSLTEHEWIAKKKAYKTRISTIGIPLDVTPGVAKGILSRIDSFYSDIRLELAEIEGQKEKIENLIRELEREKAVGKSDSERKRNATIEIQNFNTGTEKTNLYQIQRELAERGSYMRGIVDILTAKQSRLITTTGILKLEKELSPYANIGFEDSVRPKVAAVKAF